MSIKFLRLSVHQEDKALFMRCKDAFLRRHPELKDTFVSEAYLFKRICEYYEKHVG